MKKFRNQGNKSESNFKIEPIHLFGWISVHLFMGILLLTVLSGCSSDPYKDMDIDTVVEIEKKYLQERAKKIRRQSREDKMRGLDMVIIRRSDIPWK